jgi:serine/threonine protein kinase
MQELVHKHIVRYLGTQHVHDTLSIFMEYAPGGALRTFLQKGGALSDATIQSYAHQLLLGLQHLHTNGIAHR